MNLSCCAWSLPGPEEDALATIAAIGFRSIDVQAGTYGSPSSRVLVRELGMEFSCMGLSFNMGDEAALDGDVAGVRQAAIDHCRKVLDQAAELGIGTAYLVPGRNPEALPNFAESLVSVAEYAALHGIAVAVEHFPGKALPTAAATLDYLTALDHPNLYLLLDSGHLQMSGEDPAAVVAAAGERLGYVHLDDNDGEGDLHWSLLDGVLTEGTLESLLAALEASPYTGPASLELNPRLPDPAGALAKSRAVALKHGA